MPRTEPRTDAVPPAPLRIIARRHGRLVWLTCPNCGHVLRHRELPYNAGCEWRAICPLCGWFGWQRHHQDQIIAWCRQHAAQRAALRRRTAVTA